MLLAGHIGYTAGAGWVAEKTGIRRFIDFRLLAFMALFPDLVDRLIYAFIVPSAEGGRLIAHTLLFNVILTIGLILVRRRYWIYGLASLGHLLLDAHGLKLEHAFWPFLGADLSHIGLTGGAAESYSDQVSGRVREIAGTYGEAGLRAVLYEAGGLAILIFLAWRERLYRRQRLLVLLLSGNLHRGRKEGRAGIERPQMKTGRRSERDKKQASEESA